MSSRALEATPGSRALRHPEICREMARRGHGVENHSLDHSHAFAFNGMGGVRRAILAAQAALQEATGRVPRFFRPPAGIHSPLLDPVLHDLGLRLVSWTRRGFETRIGHAGFVAERLTRKLGETRRRPATFDQSHSIKPLSRRTACGLRGTV